MALYKCLVLLYISMTHLIRYLFLYMYLYIHSLTFVDPFPPTEKWNKITFVFFFMVKHYYDSTSIFPRLNNAPMCHEASTSKWPVCQMQPWHLFGLMDCNVKSQQIWWEKLVLEIYFEVGFFIQRKLIAWLIGSDGQVDWVCHQQQISDDLIGCNKPGSWATTS